MDEERLRRNKGRVVKCLKNKKINNVKNDISVTSRDARVVISSSSLRSEGLKELTSFVPKDDQISIDPIEGKSEPKAKPKRATRLSSDWQPSATDISFAKSAGLSDAQISRQAERFRDYWLGAREGLKADWPATWRNWIRKEAERLGLSPLEKPKSNLSDAGRQQMYEMACEMYRDGSGWPIAAGPSPDYPDCKVPAEMLARYGIAPRFRLVGAAA